jgi:hypothetical protein
MPGDSNVNSVLQFADSRPRRTRRASRPVPVPPSCPSDQLRALPPGGTLSKIWTSRAPRSVAARAGNGSGSQEPLSSARRAGRIGPGATRSLRWRFGSREKTACLRRDWPSHPISSLSL